MAVAPKWRMSGENDVLSTFTAHSWYQRKTLLAGQHTNSLTKNKAFLFLLLSSAILKSLLMLRKQIKGNLPGWILTEIPLLFSGNERTWRNERSLQTSAVVIERGDSRTSPDGCKSGEFVMLSTTTNLLKRDKVRLDWVSRNQNRSNYNSQSEDG